MSTHEPTLVERYVLPPAEIERLSLQRVRASLGSGGRWTETELAVVQRMIYAAGDPAIAELIRLHPDAITAGLAALRGGRSIVVDVQMVAVALDQRRATGLGCAIQCAIDAPEVVAAAGARGLPRAVLAMRALAGAAQNGVVVIGNAPSALLSVLDLVDAGDLRPALIVGTPVGFVAAAEAKAELAARPIPFITVEGTRGGSALAAAATNALLRLAVREQPDRDSAGRGHSSPAGVPSGPGGERR